MVRLASEPDRRALPFEKTCRKHPCYRIKLVGANRLGNVFCRVNWHGSFCNYELGGHFANAAVWVGFDPCTFHEDFEFGRA